jgi:hypothetical protein
MKTIRMIHVILKAAVGRKGHYVAVAGSVSAAYLAHAASYTGAPVDPNTFKAQVATLTSWHAQARDRVPGAAAQRDVALTVVATSMELLRAFNEQLGNASPEQAVTLAQGMGMYVSTHAPRAKVPLRAKQGDQPGTVVLYASVALLATGGKGGRFFSWQSSVDGGKSWLSAPSTPKSKTTITGLPVLTEVLFRACVTENKTGQGPWTTPVPFLVH